MINSRRILLAAFAIVFTLGTLFIHGQTPVDTLTGSASQTLAPIIAVDSTIPSVPDSEMVRPWIDSISVAGEILDSVADGLPQSDTLALKINSQTVTIDSAKKFSTRVPRALSYFITIHSGNQLLFSAKVPDDSINPDIFITCVLVKPEDKAGPLPDGIPLPDSTAGAPDNVIVVTAKRQTVQIIGNVAKVTITRRELLRATGTVNDPLRSLNTLPGVAAESDVSAMPIIRGGDLEESRVFLDGIPLLQPFHFGGARSIFNTAAVDNISLFKSGFPAEYHNATSGLIVVKTRSPASDSAVVSGDFNFLQYNAYAGIPLLNHKLGINISTQGSYIDFLYKRVMDIVEMSIPEPSRKQEVSMAKNLINLPGYQDFSAGLEWRPSNRLSLSLYNLHATDRTRFTQGDSVAPAVYYYNNKYYYFDPQYHRAIFADTTYGNFDWHDTSFIYSNNEYGYYDHNNSFWHLTPDSLARGKTRFQIDTMFNYQSSFNILYSRNRYELSADQIFDLSLAWQQRRWDLDFPAGSDFSDTSRYDVKLDQGNFNAGMLYTGKQGHRLKCGLQLDITSCRFDVFTLRLLHEIISKGSTNFGDYWGPVTGDSGFVFSDAEYGYSVDMIDRLFYSYKGKRLFYSASVHAEDEWNATPNTTVTYGGRIEGSTADNAVTVSPRVSVKHTLSPQNDLIGALGLYTQNNYDVAALALSQHLRPEKAWHASLGMESKLQPWLTQKIDLFGKYYYDLASELIRPIGTTEELAESALRYYRDTVRINIDSIANVNPSEIPLIVESYIFRQASYRTSFSNDGRGCAAGGEYMLRYDPFDFWNGWISLTLGKSMRQRHPGWRWHDFSLDRPLLFSIVNYYRLPRKWEIGLKYRYMSGIPYTDMSLGTPLRIGAYNKRRYSAYTSLDLRISQEFTANKQKCHFYIEGYNILNSPNLFLSDSKTRKVKMIGMNLPVPMIFVGFDMNVGN